MPAARQRLAACLSAYCTVYGSIVIDLRNELNRIDSTTPLNEQRVQSIDHIRCVRCCYRWASCRVYTLRSLISSSVTSPSHVDAFCYCSPSVSFSSFSACRSAPTLVHHSTAVTVTVTVTVTEALVLHPLLEARGHITESVRVLMPVDRMKQKCFQITMKRVRRSQQFQLRRQRVPCSRCSNRKGSVANSSTCPRHDEVATR